MSLLSRPKNFQYMAMFAIIVGVILIIFPTKALSLVIITIGSILILSSIASVLEYYRLKSGNIKPSSSMIFNSIVSTVVGVVLIMSPLFFVGFLTTLLSVLLLLGSIGQLMTLVYAKNKGVAIPFYMFIVPFIILIMSIIMLAAPIESATTITSMFGYGIVIYSIMELIAYYVIRKM